MHADWKVFVNFALFIEKINPKVPLALQDNFWLTPIEGAKLEPKNGYSPKRPHF